MEPQVLNPRPVCWPSLTRKIILRSLPNTPWAESHTDPLHRALLDSEGGAQNLFLLAQSTPGLAF